MSDKKGCGCKGVLGDPGDPTVPCKCTNTTQTVQTMTWTGMYSQLSSQVKTCVYCTSSNPASEAECTIGRWWQITDSSDNVIDGNWQQTGFGNGQDTVDCYTPPGFQTCYTDTITTTKLSAGNTYTLTLGVCQQTNTTAGQFTINPDGTIAIVDTTNPMWAPYIQSTGGGIGT